LALTTFASCAFLRVAVLSWMTFDLAALSIRFIAFGSAAAAAAPSVADCTFLTADFIADANVLFMARRFSSVIIRLVDCLLLGIGSVLRFFGRGWSAPEPHAGQGLF
jgi:hypothetical protein